MSPTEPSVAMNLADYQLDPVAERFFTQSPEETSPSGVDGARRAILEALSPTELRAMRATFAMLGIFAVALASFLVYSRVIMPVPVELASERGAEVVSVPATEPVSVSALQR